MKQKYLLDLRVVSNECLQERYSLLKLTSDSGLLPEMDPGQFVEILVTDSPGTLLRRPISIHYVDRERNELWLLVLPIGDGTRRMAQYKSGDIVNVMLPLGHGFTLPESVTPDTKNLLLVGGGVGIAPMLFLARTFAERGVRPTILLGGRTAGHIVLREEFAALGDVYYTTDNGELGVEGRVTDHPILHDGSFDRVFTCGPKVMMIAVAKVAEARGIDCEVSLENSMACGIGACLCCVEDLIDKGNTCVCTEGPVFNSKLVKKD